MQKNKNYLIHLINNKISIIISIVFYPLYIFLGILRSFNLLKRKYNILSASSGKLINDNSKYLLLKYRDNKDFIYFVKDKNLLIYRYKYNLNIKYLYSIKSIYYLVLAKNFFLSHGTFDVSPIFMRNVRVVQLWHGIPLKKIVYDVNRSESLFKKLVLNFYPHLDYSYCDKLFTGGDECMLKSAFRKSEEDCLKIGFPRFLAFDKEFFANNIDVLSSLDLKYIQNAKSIGNKIIVYAPTYRPYDDSNSIIDTLISLSKIENSLIVYKGHSIGINFNKEKFNNNIYIYKESDPYPLMNLCDLLITDYSSLFIDFSVTNKPFILYMYDYNKYKNNVGLYFELDKEFQELSCYDLIQLNIRVNLFFTNNKNYDLCKSVKYKFLTNSKYNLFDDKLFEISLLN